MSDEPEVLLDVPTLAKRLNVPRSWVYANAENGALPSFKIGRYRRFSPKSIAEWLQRAQPQPVRIPSEGRGRPRVD